MRKVFLLAFLFFVGFASGIPATEVSYFYSVSCSHCQVVAEDGILDRVSEIENVSLTKYEVTAPVAREKFLDYMDKFGIENGGIPFLVIEQGGEFSYLSGDTPIIEDLEDSVRNFVPVSGERFPVSGSGELDLWVVVVAALIDSVNPCAFGVLLFLMAVLLSMGSSKRAFRSGMIYTGVIFLVYLAAGFGIMRFAGDFLAMENVKIFVGVVVLVGALIEFKDFFWAADGMTLVGQRSKWWNISLAIPKGAKPYLEKYARKGGLVSLIILGTLVALVELPCTGGIYLAILSLLGDSGVKGLVYLIIYNFIFVLPLILISYFVYRGAKVESVNEWVQNNKKFMRLGAGIVMLGLGLSLIGVF